MTVIIGLVLLDTVVQLIVCHFSLWWIICLVARVLFACRAVGATFKVNKLVIAEGVAFGASILWAMLFHGDNPFPWLRVLLFGLMCAIACALEYIDDIFYVYVIEDADEE